MGGFDISRDKMGLDVIAKVGPGGDYLAEKHTVKNFREELWRPKYVNRENPETWSALGKKEYAQVVTEKARTILATHEPEALPDDVSATLDAIVARAGEALRRHHFKA
jgi:trimethylamine--corrinoid protein Co-methyltransferase